jgi:hypothetical protein
MRARGCRRGSGWWALRGNAPATRPRFITTVHGLNSPSRYSAIMARGERVICVSRTVRDSRAARTIRPRIRSRQAARGPARDRHRRFPARVPLPDPAARRVIAAVHASRNSERRGPAAAAAPVAARA